MHDSDEWQHSMAWRSSCIFTTGHHKASKAPTGEGGRNGCRLLCCGEATRFQRIAVVLPSWRAAAAPRCNPGRAVCVAFDRRESANHPRAHSRIAKLDEMSDSTEVPHGLSALAHASTIQVRGWSFSCSKAPAMSSEQREGLSAELHLPPAIPLPEMVFADSALLVTYPAFGLDIHFDAREALHTWMQDNAEEVEHWKPSSFDYTYSSSYKGSISQQEHPASIVVTPEKLPLDKLQQQVAILYYDRVLLYEDDIRDLGELYVEVRLRVMEFGFLLLCRYYCRIDGKNVKLVDTRYYHEFGENFVWRDFEIRNATIADLQLIFGTEQQDVPLELSGDVVYSVLKPQSSVTEKIFL